MVIKAKSAAGFAEQYIIESIWNNRFAPGTILPAERELAEVIGVTRTTLREVLQRLARDGWLTIQHGKPTQVNNFWETSGLNILETLARLDQDGAPELVENLLSARTNISVIFIRGALKNNPELTRTELGRYVDVEETGEAFAAFDYQLHHRLAFASGNPIYALIINGFKGLYSHVGSYYFADPEARELAKQYYLDLIALAEKGPADAALQVVRQHGIKSASVWQRLRKDLPDDFAEQNHL
ncbi:fatty acid metabolism transcriptional regulator FadR [Alginatibacterium sediminis]|uniref:Fatty acid metabolism regulator protein n=1 Tax=Alginatibacterium sediminis TaxID=2164068 RepID=A0A420EGS7_9ALTE|nr:fatty acid metabolism transcriptional regulator FadR [Alginatibacterium sediminis]RKF19756.1 fatty acid metabolism transcriptional regulator FadR [Alginatibacterium sediminis]